MTNKNENVNYKPMFLLSAMFMGIVGSGFMSKKEMPIQNVPSILEQKANMKLFVEQPVTMAAGETASITNIVNTILGNKIPVMVTPILLNQDGLTSVYSLGEYEVTLENFDIKKSSEQEIFVSIRKVESGVTNKNSNLVLTNVNEENTGNNLQSDVSSTYKLKVNVFDDVKPVITITQDEDTIVEGDEFDPEAYIKSVTDNVDGDIEYVTESDVDANEPGTYTVTYRASDKAGNEASASVSVTVEEKEEEEEEIEEVVAPVAQKSTMSYATSGTAGININGNAVANAALSQVGQIQDCTALVNRALAAQGINFSGYPAAYLSLGSVISASEAQPGDVIYYANGGTGAAHVAIYIGNGQAVHGGWKGNNTIVSSAYVGSGPVFIRVG